MIKRSLKILVAAALSTVAVLIVSVSAPQLHNSYLRYEVGESVVQVLIPSGRGGGTGFAIKAASGREFIVTNRHVCEAAENGYMKIKQDGGINVFKRVIYKDNKHDICLIEGDSRLSPLKLGSAPEAGDIHYIVGHPGLRQLTVSSGEYVGYGTVEFVQPEIIERSKCPGLVVELDPFSQIMYGREFFCVKSFKSYRTTAVAYGGNSGSPIVNKYGNVIAILFAGSTQQERDNYGVPLHELERVLGKF